MPERRDDQTTFVFDRGARDGREVVSLPVAQPQDLEAAFAKARAEGVEAFVVLQDTFINRHVGALSGLAAKVGVPTLAGTRDFVLAGGLLSYSVDFAETWRYAASYVDRILRGASPAELPIEQATALRLVVNLKTARELGIEIPPSILLRAEEVIE